MTNRMTLINRPVTGRSNKCPFEEYLKPLLSKCREKRHQTASQANPANRSHAEPNQRSLTLNLTVRNSQSLAMKSSTVISNALFEAIFNQYRFKYKISSVLTIPLIEISFYSFQIISP